MALSALWAPAPAPPLEEAQRAVAYAACALATLLVARRTSVEYLLAGAASGIAGVAVYALSTRLAPGRLTPFAPADGYQLAEPIGYWNALGILVVLGLVLAAGFALHAREPLARAGAAAAAPVLAATLAFTFSRGSWLALGAGLIAVLVLDPRRVDASARLLVLAVPPALAVLLASRSEGLTHRDATLAAAERDGLRLAVALTALVVVAVVLSLVLDSLGRRLTVVQPLRRAYLGAVAVLALGVAAGAVAAGGGPVRLVERGYDSFTAPLPRAGGGDLTARLASLSGNGRADYWRVAWRTARREPVLGNGAGTYEREWLRARPVAFPARDAHNLYLETLAELGPLGLALLAAALAVPFAALVRVRQATPAAAAGAAYVAFLVHAAVDWDWEVPAVAATALLVGASLVALARPPGVSRELEARARAAAVTTVAAALAVMTYAQLGNAALASAREALDEAEPERAADAARRASTLVPWSAEPRRQLGEAQLLEGDLAAARRSFREGLRRDAGDWNLWYDLALATEGPERRRAAASAAELNPLAPELAGLENPP